METRSMRPGSNDFYRRLSYLLLSTWLQFIYLPNADSKCRFPPDWKGKYFQSGLGNVIIRDGLVTTKGSCVDQHRDYYLFANRENNCFQCLLMIRRHPNIIQYKESYCLPPDSLKHVCAQIRVETPLHTLVRDPAVPISCPFQDAYYFDYNDMASGFCGQAISYAKPCVGLTKFQFHFKHCIHSTSLNEKDLDLECLATWKDGSESFLYSRVTAPGMTVKDDQYRCFNYQHYTSEIFMSMSADATCRGLRSARDGQFVLELTKDSYGWPTPTCLFPNWLKSITWRDLEGKHVMRLDERSEILSEYSTKKSKEFSQSEYRCLDVFEQNRQNKELTIRSFSTHGCLSKNQCLKLRQRSHDVIEIQKGSSADLDFNSRCSFLDNNYQIFHADPVSSSPACPHPGVYQTVSKDGCVQRMTVGCNNSNVIERTVMGCRKDVVLSDTSSTLECITTWQNEEKTFVIVREFGSANRLANCFSYSSGRRPITLEMDVICNKDVPSIVPDMMTTTAYAKLEDCKSGSSRLNSSPSSVNKSSQTLHQSNGLPSQDGGPDAWKTSREDNDGDDVDDYDYKSDVVNSDSSASSAVVTVINLTETEVDDDDDDDDVIADVIVGSDDVSEDFIGSSEVDAGWSEAQQFGYNDKEEWHFETEEVGYDKSNVRYNVSKENSGSQWSLLKDNKKNRETIQIDFISGRTLDELAPLASSCSSNHFVYMSIQSILVQLLFFVSPLVLLIPVV